MLLVVLALAALLVGFGDIARGGVTLGAGALVAAYTVFVPAAILFGRRKNRVR